MGDKSGSFVEFFEFEVFGSMAFSPNLRNRFIPEKMSYKIGLMCGIGMRLRFRLMGRTPQKCRAVAVPQTCK